MEFDDHQNMMDQLGLKTLRPAAASNDPTIYVESASNPYHETVPDVKRMHDGSHITQASQWPNRRAEIAEDYEREVYGRIPAGVPKVLWEVNSTTHENSGSIPVITRTVMGRVDNSAYAKIAVDVQTSFTVPADAQLPMPIIIELGEIPQPGISQAWHQLAIANGWAYGNIVAGSVQPDNNHLTTEGIIGLTAKGQPRKPEDWGALRAWQWGISQFLDFFEAHPAFMVDPKKVGIEGVSRYGKAALVAEAFDSRIAVGLIGSSGEGGSKLFRHIFGEGVENLASRFYYWMAGNFIKYAASNPPKTAADLPVDSHELIAMCAPRPCFISYGVPEHGDSKWIDAHGSFMAAVLAGPIYQLLGQKDLGTSGDYLTDSMPPVGHLIGGALAWRQHDGGHNVTPNWPTFFDWVREYINVSSTPNAVVTASSPFEDQI